MKITIELWVNGDLHELYIEPHRSLLDILRNELGLKGTNSGCNQGDCGACTVLFNGKAVNSCLLLAADVDGGEVVTIEGLAREGLLHPLQQAFIDEGAVQCGYCTPGMIMQSLSFLNDNPDPTPGQVKEAIEGNLCRCTGYKKIVDAILAAAKMMSDTT